MIAEIDDILNTQISQEEPGVVVAVVKDGEPVHCKGYGLANLEWGNPVQTDTVFRLASLTKQFTAAAIMLLAQEGRLHINDLITRYLPDYPMHGHEITITHLLTHTSGITPYNEIEGFFERYIRNPLSHKEALALFQDLPLQFEPGTRFRYNNSGYYLLGLIIEAVSGQSYEEFLRERLFLPLKMMHSYYMHNEAIIPRRAEGYIKTEQGYQHGPYIDMSIPYAGGAIGSTVEDLVRWDAGLREGRLLTKETQKCMYMPVQLLDGRTAEYGFGWRVETYQGHRLLHHNGDMTGFLSFMARFLDDDITIILLSNAFSRDLEGLFQPIARQILAI